MAFSFPDVSRIHLLLLLAISLTLLAGCGTLEVGIEAPATLAPPPTTVAIAPTASPSTTPTPLPTRPALAMTGTPPPTPALVRISFPVGGTNFTFTTKLTKDVPERYILQVLGQQKMTITTSRNVTIDVLDSQGKPLKADLFQPGQWQATIPQTGDYIVELSGQGFINVSIDIPPPG